MALFQQQPKDQEKTAAFLVEDLISLSLRVGVLISSLITASGLIFFLLTGYTGYPDSTFPHTLSQVWSGLLQLKPFAIIAAGLLVLLATPIFWVAASMAIFILRKDYQYTFIAGYVLLMLILSLFLGKVE